MGIPVAGHGDYGALFCVEQALVGVTRDKISW